MQIRKRTLTLLLVAVLLLGVLAWVLWANKSPQSHIYVISDEEIPAVFAGYRIAQVSDLHNDQLGENNQRLLDLLIQAEPDVVVITGDLIDSRRTDTDVALAFVREAVKIAPCYYAMGNHEARQTPEFLEDFTAQLTQAGAVVLRNQTVVLERNGEKIALAGVDDPDFSGNIVDAQGLKTLFPEDTYSVLLAHRPEYFGVYVQAEVDFVLAGHVHGGQFRLPWIGGLYGPHQGVFPEYDAGLYAQGQTQMLVSRGLGNSSFPLRFNNRPELVIAELHTGG